MKSVHVLAILLASMLVLSFAIIFLKGDVIQQMPDYKPQSILTIREVDVKPIEVTSARINVNVTAYLNHFGGKTENATMLIRAVSTETGLLGNQVTTSIPETDSEKTLSISQEILLERTGGYELKILIFDNGTIRDSGSVTVRGLGALIPESRRSGVSVSNIDFMPSSVTKGTVSLKSDIYLENKGSEASDNLKMIVKAREANSNLLADKSVTETGKIASEATVINSVALSVPDEYNYIVAVELWKGDTLINTWEKPVLLAPTKTIPKESVEKKVDIVVSDFVRKDAVPGAPAGYEGDVYKSTAAQDMTRPKSEPGFEVLLAAIALIMVIAFRRRS